MKTLLASVVMLLALAVPVFAQRSGGHGGGYSGHGSYGTYHAPASRSSSSRSAPVRSYREGGNSVRITPEHFAAHFGSDHQFHPWAQGHPAYGWSHGWGWAGHPTFWYGGFYWGFNVWPYGVWPYFWGYDDPIYIVVENDQYYACDPQHPGQKIEVTNDQKEEVVFGKVEVVDNVDGESIFIDKGFAGLTGELRTFQLPAGPHTIEIKGNRPYFGEDITVLAGHKLVVNVATP